MEAQDWPGAPAGQLTNLREAVFRPYVDSFVELDRVEESTDFILEDTK